MTQKQLAALRQAALLELARRDFWTYCTVRAPDFYKEDRLYLKRICQEFQAFYENPYERVLIINEPPRHGKTRTAGLFAEWVFGNHPNEKIITGAYNEQLSTTFSRNVRDGITERKASADRIVYSDIFPNVRIKRGSGAANMWTLEGQHVSYLATSPSGTVTGFGASLMIIDDIVKNAEEAYNETTLENHWSWFCLSEGTLVTTVNGKVPIEDLSVGDLVLSFDHSTQTLTYKPILRARCKTSEIYEVTFDDGRTIKCTGNHRFYTSDGYKSIDSILSSLRCTLAPGQRILFADLSKQGTSGESTDYDVPNLRERNSDGASVSSEEILFYRLQERVPKDQRQESICRLGETSRFSETGIQMLSKMRSNGESSSASYRPRFSEQFVRQSDRSVYIVPYRISQITRLSSNELHRVYDIEVAETHNFFADDVLTHNCNTMLSRLEKGGKVIIIATRWHSQDLSGRALTHYKAIGVPVRHILEKALQDDGTMLCDDVLDRQAYDLIVKTMGKDIAEANYNQRPIDMVGRLYSGFKTYVDIPKDEHGNSLFEQICAYVDTADQGNDYLCAIIYGLHNNQAWVLDVYYTQDNMEITEPELAKRFHKFGVQRAFIESNSGGRGFGRSVERILRTTHHCYTCMIDLFYQNKNKAGRILGAATWVQANVIFPVGWEVNFESFYTDIFKFQKEIKGNKHDDCADALSGIYDKHGRPNVFSWN